MKADVLLGLQWGDEGKGKVVDYLAPKYDIIARFQGGPNAGHTLEFGDIKHVLHQIPSGIFREDVLNVIGNGVVLDPVVFQKEIQDLEKYGIAFKDRLYISLKAQLILPTHKYLDAAIEKFKGDKKIGSTLRGIGPAYQDKVGRFGIKVGDVLDDSFKSRIEEITEKHKHLIGFYGGDLSGLDEKVREFYESIEFLKTFNLTETSIFLNRQMEAGKSILAEGAQGSLLDIDFGSYPYVTSSNTITAGACIGLGISPGRIGEVFGVFKAYCTRVGEGPFPTELFDESGKKIAEIGHEFGATTGRPRRVGWLDLPALRYAIMLNGVTQLFMMKADVLDTFDSINVSNQYRLKDGSLTGDFPNKLQDIEETIFEELKGWQSPLDESCFEKGLPDSLEVYIDYIEKHTGVAIKMVSFGPKRSQTILK
jgi:adenylosuccinate synthase